MERVERWLCGLLAWRRWKDWDVGIASQYELSLFVFFYENLVGNKVRIWASGSLIMLHTVTPKRIWTLLFYCILNALLNIIAQDTIYQIKRHLQTNAAGAILELHISESLFKLFFTDWCWGHCSQSSCALSHVRSLEVLTVIVFRKAWWTGNSQCLWTIYTVVRFFCFWKKSLTLIKVAFIQSNIHTPLHSSLQCHLILQKSF